MKNLIFSAIIVSLFVASPDLVAQELGSMSPGIMRAGGHFSMGIANTAGSFDDGTSPNATPRFGGAFGFSFNYFLLPFLALDGGIGFMGKGYRQKFSFNTPGSTEEYWRKIRIMYMEIPLGAFIEIMQIQVGLYFVLNFALSGSTSDKQGGTITRTKFDNADWDALRRFNISPKLYAGYALPIKLPFGTIYVIPGAEFSIHLINEYKGEINDNWTMRAVNILFRVGAAYEF